MLSLVAASSSAVAALRSVTDGAIVGCVVVCFVSLAFASKAVPFKLCS